MRVEPRDAFDTLFDHAPDKLQIVKRSLVNFVNRHLNKINIECYGGSTGVELDSHQFSDGLLLCFLMGQLEGYFVPLGNIFTTAVDPLLEATTNKETAIQPDNYIESSPINKLHNVNVAFQLMEDSGIQVSHHYLLQWLTSLLVIAGQAEGESRRHRQRWPQVYSQSFVYDFHQI